MSAPPFSLLHVIGNYPTGWLYSDWRPQPTVVLGIFALVAAYLWFTGPKNRQPNGTASNPVAGRDRVAFVAGCVVALVALNPPLDDWSGSYLLSAHMAQHLLLTFVSVPLWLVGTPDWLYAKLVPRGLLRRVGAVLTRPLVAFVGGNAVSIAWHLPPLYDQALRSQPLHVVQHVSFVAGAVLAWWPVFGRFAAWPRLNPPLRCLYLFASTMPNGILGVFITLGDPGLYPSYKTVPRIWGIDLATDQQVAGLLMWVGTNAAYLLLITIIFFRWASDEEAKDPRGPGAARRIDASTTGVPG